jgi:acetylornithine deacetylase/succinyl-diaminopimelate desuccinylase-like protein
MNDVLDFLRQQQSISLEQLCSFLRIPSVSADSAYGPQMGVCAEWVRNSMIEAG